MGAIFKNGTVRNIAEQTSCKYNSKFLAQKPQTFLSARSSDRKKARRVKARAILATRNLRKKLDRVKPA